MAKVQFGGGVTAITGSIGGTTFQKNHSGFIMRTRGFRSKSLSQAQFAPSNWLLRSHAQWQALTPGEQTTWTIYAGAHPKQNKFGTSKKLTGLNWYDAVNYQRDKLGLAILTSPPPHETPDGSPNFEIIISTTQLKISLLESFDFVNNRLYIWATPPTTRTTFSINQIRKFIVTMDGTEPDPFDITAAWESATHILWQPQTNFPRANIIIQLQAVRMSSGITGAYYGRLKNVSFGGTGIGTMIVGSTFIVS